jgi:aspartate kinase
MVLNRIEVGGIIKIRGLCLLGVMAAPDRPGIGATIFDALGEARLSAQFIVQCVDLTGLSNVLFCVSEGDALRARALVQPIATALSAQAVQEIHHVALLSVFGPDFRERPGIAGAVFRAMAQHEINILAISTSISTVSCVIIDTDMDQALLALHEVVTLP